MNTEGFLFATAILAATTLTANALATRPHLKTIVVESPANLPLLAQNDLQNAMYLYDTGDRTDVALYRRSPGWACAECS